MEIVIEPEFFAKVEKNVKFRVELLNLNENGCPKTQTLMIKVNEKERGVANANFVMRKLLIVQKEKHLHTNMDSMIFTKKVVPFLNFNYYPKPTFF